MTHLEGFPLPTTARHDEDGDHIPPHIPEWRNAADPDHPHYDPMRVVRAFEIVRDQDGKNQLAAHLEEHRRRGERARITEGIPTTDTKEN